MTDLDKSKIRRLDGTLLLVFSGLMRLGKASDVAAELGLTGSSISHALNRLRDIFGDPLFMRRPHGLEPTVRAKALAPSINEILELSQAALTMGVEFDPLTHDKMLRLSGLDYECSILTAPLLEFLQRRAPNMRFSFQTLTRGPALTGLENANLDVAFGFFPDGVKAPYRHKVLFEEGYRIVARRSHPLVGQGMDMERYLAADHLLVSIAGDLSGIVDDTLAERGLSRHVIAAVPQFFPALATVARTDLIATIPARLAQRHADEFSLVVNKPPMALRSFAVSAVWHKRSESDPAARWFVDQLDQVIAGL